MNVKNFPLEFRSEMPNIWNAALNKANYIPFMYSNTSIEFQLAYQISLGVDVVDYRLLDLYRNPLNPSGVLTLLKNKTSFSIEKSCIRKWQCPLTAVQLIDNGDYFYAESVGIAYPVLKGIPLLSPNHAVIASKLS